MTSTNHTSIFSPVQLGPLTLRNRIIKAATFEGMAIDNMVTDALVDFHKAFAEGRIGMTTLAYCAVSPDGQGAPNEIVVREDAVPGLRYFVDAMHNLDVAASMQSLLQKFFQNLVLRTQVQQLKMNYCEL